MTLVLKLALLALLREMAEGVPTPTFIVHVWQCEGSGFDPGKKNGRERKNLIMVVHLWTTTYGQFKIKKSRGSFSDGLRKINSYILLCITLGEDQNTTCNRLSSASH